MFLDDENQGGAERARGPGRRVCLARQGPKKRGEAAELAFMLKAVSLGFGVAKPWGERPYDFILDTETRLWRVQVKSTSQVNCGAYSVNANRHMNGKSIAYKTGEIDFLIALIVPEDCWYVIPLKAILSHKNVRIYPEKDPRGWEYGKYREAWELI